MDELKPNELTDFICKINKIFMDYRDDCQHANYPNTLILSDTEYKRLNEVLNPITGTQTMLDFLLEMCVALSNNKKFKIIQQEDYVLKIKE